MGIITSFEIALMLFKALVFNNLVVYSIMYFPNCSRKPQGTRTMRSFSKASTIDNSNKMKQPASNPNPH